MNQQTVRNLRLYMRKEYDNLVRVNDLYVERTPSNIIIRNDARDNFHNAAIGLAIGIIEAEDRGVQIFTKGRK